MREKSRQILKRIVILAGIACLFAPLIRIGFLHAHRSRDTDPEYDRYQFEQTKLLINFVRQAADLVRKDGDNAFKVFAREKKRWVRGDQYIFVLNSDGIMLYNPVYPELVGHNLLDVTDLDGKKVNRILFAEAKRNYPEGGWVHYHTSEPGDITAVWKTAYGMLVKGPRGKEYLVGSGLYNMKIEKEFARETVCAAANLLRKKGKAAFTVFDDRSSQFMYQGISIFVFTMKGQALFDPTQPNPAANVPGWKKRNMFDFRDAVGKYPVREMIEKLKTRNSAWVLYMWPKPGEVKPSKKLTYVRKVNMDGQPVIVGTCFFMATPIWMK